MDYQTAQRQNWLSASRRINWKKWEERLNVWTRCILAATFVAMMLVGLLNLDTVILVLKTPSF